MQVGNILLAAVGIGLLIFLHELGHFLAARAAGVRVEVFSLGFGPRLFGRVFRGTDFRVSLVPFGGFVMAAGQDPSDRRYPAAQSLWAKSAGQRALYWSGGVLMNALFALVVFPIVFRVGVSFDAPVVGRVAPGSAAWSAGVLPGDRIRTVNGKSIYSFDNLAVEVALAGGRPVTLAIDRGDGADVVLSASPEFDAEAGLYGLGISAALDPAPPPIVVRDGGPAAASGLRTGDRLVAVDGQPPQHLNRVGAEDAPAAIEVLRDGSPVRITVTPRRVTEGMPLRIGVRPWPHVVRAVRPGHALVERLQIRPGDAIVAIDDRPFAADSLSRAAEGATRTRWVVQRERHTIVLEQAASLAERASLADHVAVTVDEREVVVLATPDQPAAVAGVRNGDRIVAVDGKPVAAWSDLQAAVEAAGDRPIRLSVQRFAAVADPSLPWAESPHEITVAARPAYDVDFGFTYPLAILQHEVKADTIGEAIRLGWVCSLDLVKQLYVTLKRLVTGDVAAKNLGGIIRISQVSYMAAQRGPSWFWYFLALLSVNLAFVNLLPIPVLDGGHLLFLLIEKVKGSPVSTRVLGYSQIVGLVFVLLLVLFVTYNDILRLL